MISVIIQIMKSIKVWTGRNNEKRVYVETLSGRTGCLFLTGNYWNESGSKTGDMSESDWQLAAEVASRKHSKGSGWATIYENEMAQYTSTQPTTPPSTPPSTQPSTPKYPNRAVEHCANCGGQIAIGEGWGDYVGYRDIEQLELDVRPGWYFRHNDVAECEGNKVASARARATAQAKRQVLADEAEALSQQVASEFGLLLQTDTSWDDFGYRVGEILDESQNFTANRYSSIRQPDLKAGQTEVTLGFVIIKK